MTDIKIQISNASARKTGQDGLLTTGMVGATVTFSFDPAWNGLTKTAVFRGSGVVKDVLDVESVVTIPPEVLTEPGELYVGVEGRDPQGKTVLPTVWAKAGTVLPGADPSGDASTDPDLPVWAQLMAMVGELEGLDTSTKSDLVSAINELAARSSGEVDPEAVAELVEAYLSAHPPTVEETDPTVPDWAKQPEKPGYTAEEVGALSEDRLQSAVDSALAQAKESGEFDGADGDDYVLTDADKQEIAEQAAALVPEADVSGFLPTPESAAVGQYFKVSAVDENGKVTAVEAVDAVGETNTPEWKQLRAFTVPADPSADTSGITWVTNEDGGVIGFEFDTDEDGNSFVCSELSITTRGSCAVDDGAIAIFGNDVSLATKPGYQNTSNRSGWGELQKRNGVWRWVGAWQAALRYIYDFATIGTTGFTGASASDIDTFQKVGIKGDGAFNSGYSFDIWGR